MWLHELASADAACGGKAAGLSRLVRAGLPVPEGFVLDDRAFRHAAGELHVDDAGSLGHQLAHAAERIARTELPSEIVREVEARAAALGVLAVRSSATIEDGAAGAAAGVFSSRRAVPAHDVWAAIRAVWTSALTPLAAAYARRRGGSIAIGVIVQRFVPGELVTIYTRPPGAASADEMLVQRGERVTRVPRSSHVPRDDERTSHAGAGDAHGSVEQLALRAEAAIGATEGADVEIIDAGDAGRWIVQARPVVHPVARPRTPPPPAILAPLVADGRRWTWDVTHNPDPLSPAQAGIVERVEQAGIAPCSLRVCAGFLYTAPRTDAPPSPSPPPSTAEELEARVATLEQRMAAALGDEDPPSVDDAIARYLAFYAIWAGELAPLVSSVRRGLDPAELAGARPSAVEVTLLAAARGELDEDAAIARLGVLSPAWDVAVPTYAERPELVRAAIERARLVTDASSPTLPAPSALARAAADLAERDDVWFARAQHVVRRALLARARALGIDADDIFWLPLADVLAAEALDPDDARRRAAGARAAASRSTRWAMPIVIGGEPTPAGEPLRGIGTGPRITGRVVRFASLGSVIAVGPGDVVVTRAVTPALAVLVIGCAALVSETGGLLDHGAALARELGIPCVVGCHDAWSLLTDGMLVTVDGDGGVVTPL